MSAGGGGEERDKDELPMRLKIGYIIEKEVGGCFSRWPYCS